MIVYGSGISDGNRHNHDDLPILLAGKGGGTIKPGRHIKYSTAAAQQPLPLDARPHGRAHRPPGRQHGAIDEAGCLSEDMVPEEHHFEHREAGTHEFHRGALERPVRRASR